MITSPKSCFNNSTFSTASKAVMGEVSETTIISDEGFDRFQILGQFSHAVVHGNVPRTQFLLERRLRQPGNFRRLAKRRFFRNKQANRQMQGSLARRQRRLDGFGQSQLHDQSMNLNRWFRKG